MKYYKVPEDHLRKLLEAEDLLDSLYAFGLTRWEVYPTAIDTSESDLTARINIELSKFEKLPD